MDASILTTFFCFIILVLVALIFVRMSRTEAMVEHHIDLTISEKEHARTALKILQKLEAQIHLMFNNAPPVPGEPISPDNLPVKWGTVSDGKWFSGQTEKRFSTDHPPVPAVEIIKDDIGEGLHWEHPKPKEPMMALAKRKLKEHQIKAKPPQFPKKRGRPRKASKS